MTAKMGGLEKSYYDKLKAQGKGRIVPKTFARNNLSMGGVNKDLGGGATSGVKQALPAGRADANTMKGRK
jgi:hypothetical protein